jgi:acyl-coenzyme A synthetase/AMP-(fatty) acid ligase
MSAWPLIAHDRPDAVLAFRDGRPISAAQFLHDARSLAARLPDAQHVLNFCNDRYEFAVGLAASLLRAQRSVLPSTHTSEVIRQLRAFAPDVYCLTDDPACPIELPQLQCRPPAALRSVAPLAAPIAAPLATPLATMAALGPWQVPQIDEQQLAAYVFTSGSTGTPVPHPKSWGRLVQCVRRERSRLRPNESAPAAILGTVPAQHMYGFESTVLLPLQSGSALCADRPFFPADIAAALSALPPPRVLFSTPVHLRALLSAGLALPPLELIVSATAMLSDKLAREVESRYGAPLLEIYGSTESGQIASRRSALEQDWQLWPEVRLQLIDGRCWVQGGHVAQPTLLADVIEPVDEQRFLLRGRTADLVNIAGKRSSLAYLNHQLHAIPGVVDGVFFVRDDAAASLAGVTRLAALVVAPELDAAAIILALRERIDPVFLPRPLLLVEQLPRNQTGKLPQHMLRSLAAQAAARQPHLFV